MGSLECFEVLDQVVEFSLGEFVGTGDDFWSVVGGEDFAQGFCAAVMEIGVFVVDAAQAWRIVTFVDIAAFAESDFVDFSVGEFGAAVA